MPQIAPLPSGMKIGKRFRVPPVSKMRGRTPTWLYIFAATSALLAVVALGGALAWSRIFDSVLASQLKLTPNSRSFQNWVAPSVPLYFDIYLFNWTNADMFPEKPVLNQIGPFSFREERVHVNVTFNENGTMSYRTHRRWYFDEERSNGNLEDEITSINGVAASAAYRARSWGYLQQKGLSIGLTMFKQQFSVTKTASELLFEGYNDSLLDLAKSLPASTTGGAPPVDKFGWFYGRNDTLDTDGYMEITTGQHRGTVPGQIVRWNFEDHLPYYSGECSKLLGSAGEFVPRNLTEESVFTMFVPDLCRTVNMDYVKSGEVEGLNYHKYALSQRSFDNSTVSSANTCFCNGPCAWSGVMNVSACRYDSPAFISLPHFLYGDELRSLVDGMYPDPELHDFYFAVEPKLGIPVEVAARFQLNMFIDSVENVDLYSNVPRMLFPIFWVEQKVQMEYRVLEELKYVRAILDWGAVVCACAALFFAILVAIATCWARKPQYLKTELLTSFEKPKDEAELKLNPK